MAAQAVSCTDASFLGDDGDGCAPHIAGLKLGVFASTSKLSIRAHLQDLVLVLPRCCQDTWRKVEGATFLMPVGAWFQKSTAGQVESSCALASLLTSVKQVNTILKCLISTGFASQDHRVNGIP